MKYNNFKELEEKIGKLQIASNHLAWDLKINTKDSEKEHVSKRLNELNTKIFQLKNSDEYLNLVTDLINSTEFSGLTPEEQNSILRLQRKIQEYKRVPLDFYRTYDLAITASNDAWEKAKVKNDYQIFKPHLAKVIKLTKELYQYKNPQMNVYDAMLNDYSEGLNTTIVDELFNKLKKELVPLIQKVKTDNVITYEKRISYNELNKAANILLNYIGFDIKHGILGIYPHGFMEKLDVNTSAIAYSYHNDPASFVSTIIHEGGHGIFEQNISDTLNKYSSFTIDFFDLHEAQSRFYENILGRNINFWLPIYDEVNKVLKLDLTVEEFVKLLNQVRPSLIRTDADELTYALHIIVRYEIEKKIFNENVSLDELPSIWCKLMEEYLGVTPKCDNEGLMQDVHWSDASFGYFPSYLLGNIYDGMMLEKIESDLGDVDEILESGNIKKITNYLIDYIYKNGGAYNSIEIFKKLNVNPLINYYKKKYLK